MLIGGKNGVVGSRVRVKSNSSRVVFRGREGHIDGFHRLGEEDDVATWRFSKTRNDVSVEFAWCCWAFAAADLEVVPEPPPEPASDAITLDLPRINRYASDYVGMTAEDLFATPYESTKNVVHSFLDMRYLVLRDGALVWNDKREEEDPRNNFSLTEDF
jgi:hypothetical protein